MAKATSKTELYVPPGGIPSTDVAQLERECAALKDLLLWLRKHRIAAGHVQVRDVSVQVTMDHGMAHADTERKPAETARKGIYEEMGGALFAEPTPEQAERTDEIEPTVEDDD